MWTTPGTLVEGDVLPGDHAVLDLALHGQLVEAGDVRPPDELGAGEGRVHLRVLAEDRLDPIGGDDHVRLIGLDARVGRARVDRRRDVRRQRPRRRRPHEQVLARAVLQAEAGRQRRVHDVAVGVGRRDLVL